MLVKTEAIVLHTLKYGDSKLFVDMFTRAMGRLSFVVAVSKSGRSRLKKQLFQPMTLLEIEGDIRQRAQLHKLTDACLLVPYASIPLSPEKLAITLFVAEFLYHGLRSEQRDEPLFDYISGSFQWLDAAVDSYANFHLTFLMRLSRFLGFYPNLHESEDGRTEHGEQREDGKNGAVKRVMYFDMREGRFCDTAPAHNDYLVPAEARMIHLLMRMDYPTMHLFKLSRQDRQRILDVLLQYYQQHLPDFPELKSLAVLHQLWV